jgi:hypothetical protein
MMQSMFHSASNFDQAIGMRNTAAVTTIQDKSRSTYNLGQAIGA